MPVEIKELHIKTVVDSPPSGQSPQQTPSGNNGSGGDQNKIIAFCLEQVMEVLKNKNER